TVSPTAEYDSGCLYSAVASPPAGVVSMRKNTPAVSGTSVRLSYGSSRVADDRKSPQSSALQAQRKTPDGVSSLEQNRRKKVSAKDAVTPRNDDDQHSLSSLDDDGDDVAQMLSHEDSHEMLTPDDINTPDELEESIMERLGPGTPDHCSREGGGPVQHEGKDESSFRAVVIQGIERRIDMQVIEPYKKVLSHGGHLVSGEAIIVFSACFLPDRARHDYDYVMDHLFMYVLTALDQLIAEDYVLVYLHGATTRANMPSFNWLKRCYQMIDRRLRKNLQVLYLVHPTFWVKTVVVMIRPFVSAKFSRKLRFVANLRDLAALIPMEQVCIPSRIKQYDDIRESLLKKDEQTTVTK
ncbi:Bcl2-/adenovirus E1B 19kDa-interacting protein 2, partial [Trinorchestia longiramus]